MSLTPHHVHGLAADNVAPDWPPLTMEDVQGLLRHYPALATPLEVLWRSPRPLSAAAVIRSGQARFFVKRHHPAVRSLGDLAEEHGFIRHLQAAGIAIPRLIENSQGLTATTNSGWNYELSELAGGQDLYRDSPSWTPPRLPAHARSAGRALASLHLAAENYLAPQRKTSLLLDRGELIASSNPVDWLQSRLPQRPGLQDYLRQRCWQPQIEALFAKRPTDLPSRLAASPPLWTHNDWHVSNLTWQLEGEQASVCNVLDFGLSARTTAIHDLATAIERNAVAWLELERGMEAVHLDIARQLLAGYNEIRPLSRHDLALLHDVLPWVHVDFALSEVEYFQAITRSPADADVAWDTFLLGHAQWFETPPGQRLLTALVDGR